MKVLGVIALLNLIIWHANAQNVGIGIANPADILQVHGGNGFSSSTLYTNNGTGPGFGSGMRVGIQYQAANAANQYGFISLPGSLPFIIWQNNEAKLQMGANGHFGINSKPFNPFRLAVSGPAVFFPEGQHSASVTVADTNAYNGLASGYSMQKTTPGGKHFSVLAFDPFKAKARLEFNFKNGDAVSRTANLLFDSSGNMGLSPNYEADLKAKFHVFGDQRIEGASGAKLYLHSPKTDYTNGSAIYFQYTPYGGFSSNPLDHNNDYFIKLNNSNASSNIARTLAIGRSYRAFGGIPGGEIVALSVNEVSQVGLLKYPDRTRSDIKLDINGNTRIDGGLQLINIGEGAGKLLVSDGTGKANWQNPAKITLDQPSISGLSLIEFRNGGGYKGAMGWSQEDGRFFFYDGESNTNTLVVNNGKLGIQRDATTNALEVNGNASKSTAGSWLGNSDARLKVDIEPIVGALESLLQLKGITFKWNDSKTGNIRPTGTQMGFTAQNVQNTFPEMVSTDAQGYLQTAYGSYDPLLVEAIRELSKKIEMLEQKLSALLNK